MVDIVNKFLKFSCLVFLLNLLYCLVDDSEKNFSCNSSYDSYFATELKSSYFEKRGNHSSRNLSSLESEMISVLLLNNSSQNSVKFEFNRL